MITVDSSVWINHLNGRLSAPVDRLHRLLRGDEAGPILVGDIVMYEVLGGLRSARGVREVRRLLEAHVLVTMLGFELIASAVSNFRTLRAQGVTMSTVDMIIGSYCLETGASLLTADRDFLRLREHLGLQLLCEPGSP